MDTGRGLIIRDSVAFVWTERAGSRDSRIVGKRGRQNSPDSLQECAGTRADPHAIVSVKIRRPAVSINLKDVTEFRRPTRSLQMEQQPDAQRRFRSFGELSRVAGVR